MSKEHKIQMVVFDWAGTTVDYASAAPHKVFDLVFTNHQIRLSAEEIDRPMGMEKKLTSGVCFPANLELISSKRSMDGCGMTKT